MHRRAAYGDRSQAAQVSLGDIRVVEQPGHHRRHGAPPADPVPLDQHQGLARIEPPAGHDQGAAHRDRAQQRLHAADVEQRAGVQADVTGGLVDLLRQAAGDVQQHVQAREQRAVGEHDGLRPTGRSRREDDGGGLFLIRGPRAGDGCRAGLRMAGSHGPRAQADGTLAAPRASASTRAGRVSSRALATSMSLHHALASTGTAPSCRQAQKLTIHSGLFQPRISTCCTRFQASAGQRGDLAGHGLAELGEADLALALDHVRPRAPAVGECQQLLDPSGSFGVHPVRDAPPFDGDDLVAPRWRGHAPNTPSWRSSLSAVSSRPHSSASTWSVCSPRAGAGVSTRSGDPS